VVRRASPATVAGLNPSLSLSLLHGWRAGSNASESSAPESNAPESNAPESNAPESNGCSGERSRREERASAARDLTRME